MKQTTNILILLSFLLCTSCVTKEQYETLQKENASHDEEIGRIGTELSKQMKLVGACEQEKERLKGDIRTSERELKTRAEQIQDLKDQIADLRLSRNQTAEQVGDLTVLSQSANDNMPLNPKQILLI